MEGVCCNNAAGFFHTFPQDFDECKICMCIHIYIYIYIYRERERERERDTFLQALKMSYLKALGCRKVIAYIC